MSDTVDLREYETVVFFTGAGMSAASGVPTYRGAGGIWKEYDYHRYACQTAFELARGFRDGEEPKSAQHLVDELGRLGVVHREVLGVVEAVQPASILPRRANQAGARPAVAVGRVLLQPAPDGHRPAAAPDDPLLAPVPTDFPAAGESPPSARSWGNWCRLPARFDSVLSFSVLPRVFPRFYFVSLPRVSAVQERLI